MSHIKLIPTFALLLGSLLLFAACGGTATPAPSTDAPTTPQLVGDAARGEQLYNEPIIGSAGALGCASCHSLSEGTVLVGPSHYQVGTIAESRIAGMSAEAYLHESIRDTDAYLVEGFTAGLMPNYDQDLSDQEVSDLVAYLLTLR